MGKELRPKKYPHFMESKYRTKDKIYLSRKILGQLYDQVERADFTPFYDNPFDERILNAYQSNDDTLSRVARIKELYDADVRRIQAQHGIKTEFEVWSTFILEHNLEFKDYTFTEEMGRITGALKKKFQDMCIEQAGATGINDMQKLKPFVAAMYQVTAQEIAAALKECERTKKVGGIEVPDRKKIIGQMPLMSFPWIFVSQLGEIANPTVIRSIPVASRGLQHRTKKHYPFFDDMLAGAGAIHTKYGTVQPGEMLMVELEEASVSVYEDQGHAAMVEQGVTDTARPMQPTGKPIMDDSVANGPHPPSNTKFDGVNEGVSRTTEESQNTVGNVNMTSASYTETEKPKELVDLTDVTGSDGMYTPPIENYRAAAFIPTQLEFKLMTTDVAASGPTTPTLDSVSTAPDSDVCDDEFEREDVLIDFDDKPSGLEALRSL
jgi:RNA-dependent RNA polymerase